MTIIHSLSTKASFVIKTLLEIFNSKILYAKDKAYWAGRAILSVFETKTSTFTKTFAKLKTILDSGAEGYGECSVGESHTGVLNKKTACDIPYVINLDRSVNRWNAVTKALT